MRTQASSIIACDLFTVESIRLKTLHVLFFIDLHSRRVLIGGVTEGPANLAWCTQIARNLSEAREGRSEPIRFLFHDRDKRFGSTLRRGLQGGRHRDRPNALASPQGQRLRRAMDPDHQGRMPRSSHGAGLSSPREGTFDLRKALQRGTATPGPRAETAGGFTTPKGLKLRTERDQAPRSPRRTHPRVLPEDCLSRTDSGSAGRRARDIGAFPPEQRIEARLRAALPPQAFTDGPMIAPLMTMRRFRHRQFTSGTLHPHSYCVGNADPFSIPARRPGSTSERNACSVIVHPDPLAVTP